MQKMIVLGTGNAIVTKCYNTCFALQQQEEYFLVDAGGGNQILFQLNQAGIPLTHIHHLFVSHEHTDHILGVVWLVRMIGALIKTGKYTGTFNIYCHQQLVSTIKTLCHLTLQKQLTDCFDHEICFHGLNDGDTRMILEHEVVFFDILSTKAKQYGFTFINDNQEKITFAGDEPYNKACDYYVRNSDWLLHEAFCLYSQKDIYRPYEKHHSTAKDAAVLASELGVKHLVLWHTEEDNLSKRKELYTNEAQQYFQGDIYVPDDLDIISLY